MRSHLISRSSYLKKSLLKWLKRIGSYDMLLRNI